LGAHVNVKLLLDENLSVRVAETLRKAEGLDVVHARDRGLLEAEDHVVLERAYAEDRILVTCDVDDFIKLAGARELHPGLVSLKTVSFTVRSSFALFAQPWPFSGASAIS